MKVRGKRLPGTHHIWWLSFPLLALTCQTPVCAEGGHGSFKAAPAKGGTSTAASKDEKDFDVQLVTPHLVPEMHKPKPEAPEVLDIVKSLAKASARGDEEKYKTLLDDDCTVFDEETNKTLTGKDQAVALMVKDYQRDRGKEEHGTISLKIDEPYVKVAGNSAIVTYRIEKTIGQSKPIKRTALVTQVFLKADNSWKLSSHTRGKWSETAF